MATRRLIPAVPLIIVLLLASALRAEETAAPTSKEEESSTELAKKQQNPVADLISVPFESNFFFNTGQEKRTVWDLNIEPVIPIHLTDDWNLITRTIVPVINLPSVAPGVDDAAGLGDINPTFFLSPSGSHEAMSGIGPTVTLPAATDSDPGEG